MKDNRKENLIFLILLEINCEFSKFCAHKERVFSFYFVINNEKNKF